MNSTPERTYERNMLHAPFEAQPYKKLVASGSMMEAIGGAGAVVFAILSLASVLPREFAAISVICIGAALTLQGSAIGATISRLFSVTGGGALGAAELAGGVTFEFLGGAAGIVLGVLALLGVSTGTLIAVAATVFGGVLLLASGATTRLSFTEATAETQSIHSQFASGVSAAAVAQVFIGIGALVLGILALVGISDLVLTVVALLSVGACLMLCGSVVGSRALSHSQP